MIEIKEIDKSYEEKVLDSISFKVQEGEIVSILGPSGCGKSTLLKIVKGLEDADSGVVDAPSDKGMMFQEPRLLKWRNVSENVSLGMELKGKQLEEEKISELLEMVDLGEKIDEFPVSLSGGEKQRVAFARTMALDPEILLMDEPLSALDERTREILQDKFLDICTETGKTTLFVTHSVREAWKIGERIVVLSEKPTEVKEIMEKDESKKDQQIEELRRIVKD